VEETFVWWMMTLRLLVVYFSVLVWVGAEQMDRMQQDIWLLVCVYDVFPKQANLNDIEQCATVGTFYNRLVDVADNQSFEL
jgi:hypothetical protein